jgi:hypothetical protein
MAEKADFDSDAHAEEKQVSREEEDASLANGSISVENLKAQNGFFSALPLHRFVVAAVGDEPVHHPERGHSERK